MDTNPRVATSDAPTVSTPQRVAEADAEEEGRLGSVLLLLGAAATAALLRWPSAALTARIGPVPGAAPAALSGTAVATSIALPPSSTFGVTLICVTVLTTALRSGGKRRGGLISNPLG